MKNILRDYDKFKHALTVLEMRVPAKLVEPDTIVQHLSNSIGNSVVSRSDFNIIRPGSSFIQGRIYIRSPFTMMSSDIRTLVRVTESPGVVMHNLQRELDVGRTWVVEGDDKVMENIYYAPLKSIVGRRFIKQHFPGVMKHV